jgi:hypothetical protein
MKIGRNQVMGANGQRGFDRVRRKQEMGGEDLIKQGKNKRWAVERFDLIRRKLEMGDGRCDLVKGECQSESVIFP